MEDRVEVEVPRRSDVAVDIDVPTPPFWGDRIVKGIALADVAAYLDERATFMGQWGLKGSRGGPSYEELVETRRTAAAARLAGPYPDRRDCGVRRHLWLLALLQPGQRSRRSPPRIRCLRSGRGAAPLHLPAAEPGTVPLPGRLLPRS